MERRGWNDGSKDIFIIQGKTTVERVDGETLKPFEVDLG
jgi:hypothetical protein